MMLNPNLVRTEYSNVSQAVTIVPRLEYSHYLLSGILDTLKRKKIDIKKSNRVYLKLNNNDHTCVHALDFERTISFSLEILSKTQKKINSISDITSIPKLLPLIPMMRTVSAQLYALLPVCSQNLSELSVHLGSVILDSAILTESRFDFSQSNIESSLVLNEVKLMVNSKINKQYPNLDFSKACNT
ncbi:hypothetical protein YTPLAS73_01430 [Nitrosarchaeum sp.]|nr:hypothetical protein YTPLAS73_01430 [Nitrosarchaeum sp.]